MKQVERRDVTEEIDHHAGRTIDVRCLGCGNDVTIFCYYADEGEPVERQATCCGYGYGLAIRGYDLVITHLDEAAGPAPPPGAGEILLPR